MDISLKLAKLAKEKGFNIKTIKFYSEKKNGSRNTSEPKNFNSLKPDDMYGETWSCVDLEVIKKYFKVKVDSEEEVMDALGAIGSGLVYYPATNVTPVIEEEEIIPEENKK